MEIVRVNDTILELRSIDPFFAELLRQIPDETDPRDDTIATERLFSRPVEDPTDEVNEEWKEYVEPELRHLFESATETVAGDLKALKGNDNEFSMQIPVKHLPHWLNTLNQARLSLAMRNRFTDEELSAEFSTVINSRRDMHLLQIHIYGFLQEMFIRELELPGSAMT